MRVLILSRQGIAKAFTGDSTQMRNTISHMRSLVEKITHVFVANDGSLFDENGNPLSESLLSLCQRHDVAHQLPRLNFRVHKAIQNDLAEIPVVVSTVYWHDFARVRIAWRNNSGIKDKLRASVGAWRAGSKYLQDYRKGCDVILPNSWVEGENVRRFFRLAAHVASMPVPNALDLPEFEIGKLKKPETIPFHEYIVCPAAFATRKNQLGLIKAMKNPNMPVVFMGNPLDSARKYWMECKRQATTNMFFLDHLNNTEMDYWAVLRHARCACLPADCETPGIALLEAAYAGARPVVTQHGGTQEYYGFCAEYLNPLSVNSIRTAVKRGWERGRLTAEERHSFERFSWDWTAMLTVEAYRLAIRMHNDLPDMDNYEE